MLGTQISPNVSLRWSPRSGAARAATSTARSGPGYVANRAHGLLTDFSGRAGTGWEKQKRKPAEFPTKQHETGPVGRGRDGACRPPSSTPLTSQPHRLTRVAASHRMPPHSGDPLEQDEVERIARKVLTELGVSASTLPVVHPGAQPGMWRIDVGDRSLTIRCGQGSTAQWVRTQIFEQFLSR